MVNLPELSSETSECGIPPEEMKEEIDEYSLEDFQSLVECGGFVDSDGFGEWVAANGTLTGVFVNPSQLFNAEAPVGATRIRWYNR